MTDTIIGILVIAIAATLALLAKKLFGDKSATLSEIKVERDALKELDKRIEELKQGSARDTEAYRLARDRYNERYGISKRDKK